MSFYDELELYGDDPALITRDEEISYLQLQNHTSDLLRQIKKRALVFCVCSNTIASVVGYIGFLRGNCVPVLINSGIDKEMFQNLLSAYMPEYIWAPRDFWDGMLEFRFKGHALIETGYKNSVEMHPDLALLLTTSGSTGSPKLVRQSYKNISSNAESIAQYLNITDADRPITTLPMSYTYGLSIINSHLLKGASIVLTDESMMKKSFWE